MQQSSEIQHTVANKIRLSGGSLSERTRQAGLNSFSRFGLLNYNKMPNGPLCTTNYGIYSIYVIRV